MDQIWDIKTSGRPFFFFFLHLTYKYKYSAYIPCQHHPCCIQLSRLSQLTDSPPYLTACDWPLQPESPTRICLAGSIPLELITS